MPIIKLETIVNGYNILKLVWGSSLKNAYWTFEKHVNGWYVYPSTVIWHPSFLPSIYWQEK